jgi:hypothetical protein
MQQSPVVMAVDDIQWLDESSVTVLTRALRRLEADPIGLLATVRGEREVHPGLISAVPRAGALRLSLVPLALGAIPPRRWVGPSSAQPDGCQSGSRIRAGCGSPTNFVWVRGSELERSTWSR